jgi:2-polyprenyl-3-methyl-5-hydroxy-6-metoxy-1,4-benzoquinol methylase
MAYMSNRHRDIRWVFCAAENVNKKFEPKSFDVVTIFDTLEHVLDDVGAVDAALEVLDKPGLLIVNVPEGTLYGDDSKEHMRVYDQSAIRKLIPGIELETITDEKNRPTIFGTYHKK